MRRFIPVWFLLILPIILPETSQAQTRFFQRGDSGFTGSWGTFSENNSLGYRDTGYRVAYTYKGWFDVGIGFAMSPYDDGFGEAIKGMYGKVVLLRAKEGADIGLEVKGQYSTESTKLSFRDPRFVEYDDRTFETGLRGFFNQPFGPKFEMIIGIGFIHRFNRHRILDMNDEITFGHDYGKYGFGCDFHFLVYRIVHASLGLDYEQDNLGDDWSAGGYISLGVLIGRSAEQGGGHNE
ncbi:MAG: hypothetical protein ABFS42_13015 [Candidatus Krumholzibacteriota bacterium]